MLKRRVVLVGMHERECNRLVRSYARHCLSVLTLTQGTADSIAVKNGVTRIIYPTGACYEGEVMCSLTQSPESCRGYWYEHRLSAISAGAQR